MEPEYPGKTRAGALFHLWITVDMEPQCWESRQETGELPMVINISFGNNYGSHKGDSLLETYIDMVSSTGRLVICTSTGNNGNQPLHEGGILKQGQTRQIELSVSSREPTLNVQLWKSYEDEMSIYIENPSGNRIGPLDEKLGPQRYKLGNTELLIYYGKPGPYHLTQEIYIDFLPVETYVDSGDWKIILSGKKVRGGEYYLWLPGGNILNRGTGFYEPRAYGTLTIPATARRIIAVGAYDSLVDSYADFSGRGSRMLPYLKPDLVAPGVNIVAPVPGGGYRTVTGTSFAAPFVSGAAALLMQWGIVNGNDPCLYGEKVKAYFRRGARPLSGYEMYPNEEVGWGHYVQLRAFQNELYCIEIDFKIYIGGHWEKRVAYGQILTKIFSSGADDGVSGI